MPSILYNSTSEDSDKRPRCISLKNKSTKRCLLRLPDDSANGTFDTKTGDWYCHHHEYHLGQCVTPDKGVPVKLEKAQSEPPVAARARRPSGAALVRHITPTGFASIAEAHPRRTVSESKVSAAFHPQRDPRREVRAKSVPLIAQSPPSFKPLRSRQSQATSHSPSPSPPQTSRAQADPDTPTPTPRLGRFPAARPRQLTPEPSQPSAVPSNTRAPCPNCHLQSRPKPSKQKSIWSLFNCFTAEDLDEDEPVRASETIQSQPLLIQDRAMQSSGETRASTPRKQREPAVMIPTSERGLLLRTPETPSAGLHYPDRTRLFEDTRPRSPTERDEDEGYFSQERVKQEGESSSLSQPPLINIPDSLADFLFMVPHHLPIISSAKIIKLLQRDLSKEKQRGFVYVYRQHIPVKAIESAMHSKRATSRKPSDPYIKREHSDDSPESPSSDRDDIVVLKVGTSGDVPERLKDQEQTCKREVHLVEQFPRSPDDETTTPPALVGTSAPAIALRKELVPYYKVVEKLIQAELFQYRRYEVCVCKTKHREFFDIPAYYDDIEAVREVVERWVEWGYRVYAHANGQKLH